MSDSRKQIRENGSTSDEFLINEEFITMLDYYVMTSLSTKSSEAESFRTFYCIGGNVQGPRRTARPVVVVAAAAAAPPCGAAQVSDRIKYLLLLIDEARRRRGARAGAGVAVCAVPRVLAARGGGARLLRALCLWLSVS